MKIEECADKLLDEVGCTAELDDLPEFMELLQALVYDESKRCAAVAFANPLGEGQFIGQEILATSPGKVGG